jgi:hypothetical protein
MPETVRMTKADWMAEGARRFGPDQLKWQFVCPACGYVASVEDWKKVGAPITAVAFSCIGRWMRRCRDAFGKDLGPGPCNYAGGGLFRLNPVCITDIDTEHNNFAFAEAEVSDAIR